jgi:NADH dehydrogenase (ubiquinone) 1 alpha/beta subcomplex 1
MEEVTDRIVQVVKNFDKVDPSKVSATSKFADDLGLDSLDTVEVVMAVEDEFAIEIPDAEADKIASIEDAAAYISAHPMAK